MDSTVALSDLQLAMESVCGQQSEDDCYNQKRRKYIFNYYNLKELFPVKLIDVL